MNRSLAWSSGFKRSYKKYVKRNPQFKTILFETFSLMEKDLFHHTLYTHKLSGHLKGLYACSCGYDCRVVFSLEKNTTGQEEILIISVGTHDAVY